MIRRFRPSDAAAYLEAAARFDPATPLHQISRAFTDGVMGSGLVGDTGAAIVVGDFIEPTGCFDPEVYRAVLSIGEAHVLDPPQCWIGAIRRAAPARFRRYERVAFDPLLPEARAPGAGRQPTEGSGTAFEIVPIGPAEAEALRAAPWSQDLVANTMIPDDRGGFGFVARLDGTIIGGVGCYAVYADGVEVEIDTHADYRRRGVARALGRRMVRECAARSLACHWDAMNAASAALAGELGFVPLRRYDCYLLCG